MDPIPTILFSKRKGKAKFKTALRKYQHTHSIYSVDKFFYVKR